MAIQKRAPGRYEVSVDDGFDEVAGRRRRKWVSVRGTKKDAAKVERELLSKRDRGISLVTPRLTLAEYMERWLREYAASAVAPSTLTRYQIAVRAHIVPHLGHLQLAQVQPLHIQELHRLCRAESLAQSTVRQHHRILSKALKLAVQWQLLITNPAAAINAPRVDRTEMQVLSATETRDLLARAAADALFPFVYLAVTTGARSGELCGLRWSDVDVERGTLAIRRTAQRLPGQGLQLRPTKTQRSSRALSLSPEVVSFLTALRDSQRGTFGAACDSDTAFVLPQPNGSPHEPEQISRAFERLRKAVNLPPGFRFHDLRHTHATLLLEAGIHPKVVSERLGHSTVSITLDRYSHVLPTLQDAAAVALDNVLHPSGISEGTQK